MRAVAVIIALHILGFSLAMVMGKILRLTLFRGEATPFVMELPPYRMPVPEQPLPSTCSGERAGCSSPVPARSSWPVPPSS